MLAAIDPDNIQTAASGDAACNAVGRLPSAGATYSRSHKQRLTEPILKELEKKLRDQHAAWTEDNLWNVFAAAKPGKVKGRSQAGVKSGPDQLAWLNLIHSHLATAICIEADDFDYAPFMRKGGLGKAHELFGDELPALLDELNEVLAA